MPNKIHQTIVASLSISAIGLSVVGSSPAASAGMMGGPGPTPHFNPGPTVHTSPPPQTITPGGAMITNPVGSAAANTHSIGSANDGGYSVDCLRYLPVYDRWGRRVGRQPTKIC
jgi:hypothetical protein